MAWQQIRERLLAAAVAVRKNKVADVATELLLESIPVVGGFLGKYWTKIGDDPDPATAEQMAALLERVASDQKYFDNLNALVQKQGDLLIRTNATLADLTLEIVQIGDDVGDIKQQLTAFIDTLSTPSAKGMFEIAAAMKMDHRRSLDRISSKVASLRAAGADPALDAQTLTTLGMLSLGNPPYDDAEEWFLAATARDRLHTEAYLGLCRVYQLRSTELLREENYGLAKAALKKAEGYGKTALQHDPADFRIQVDLGYVSKDIAQTFARLSDKALASAALDRAEKHFNNALKLNDKDASAHNGLGSVHIIRGNYPAALDACDRAIELQDDYLFAHHDRANVCYYLAADLPPDKSEEQSALLLKGLTSYLRILELADAGQALPQHAQENLHKLYAPIIKQVNREPSDD